MEQCKTCKHCNDSGRCTHFDISKCVSQARSCDSYKPKNDAVSHPAHYTSGSIECIEALKAALGDKFIGFLIGNVLKYCWRYQHKNGLEDLRKAQYYLNRAIEEMSNEQPVP